MPRDYLSAYKQRVYSTKCGDSQKDELILNSVGKTNIFHRRNNKDIIVNLILKQKKEGLGIGKVLTWAKDDLQIGDYFVWKNRVFLVTSADKNVFLDDYINKFFIRECNCKIKYDFNGQLLSTYKQQDAIFIGRLDQRTGNGIESGEGVPRLDINDDSVLIYSGLDIAKFDSCMIEDTQWKITASDFITAKPIVYSTCTQVPVTMVEKNFDVGVDTPHAIKYYAGNEYSFATENYFFESRVLVEYTRNKNSIIIKMPADLEWLEFNTMKNGQVVKNKIKIGEY